MLQDIRDGKVTLQFRRWKRATVKTGGTLTTSVGVLDILDVTPVTLSEITVSDALASGHPTRTALLEALRGRPGTVHRIALRFRGEDPRLALREAASTSDIEGIPPRLDRMDRASKTGPWTHAYLEIIRARPAVRAPELATVFGMETAPFKARVRRLKSLGLTESLKVGYRLSPRGEAVLERIESDQGR